MARTASQRALLSGQLSLGQTGNSGSQCDSGRTRASGVAAASAYVAKERPGSATPLVRRQTVTPSATETAAAPCRRNRSRCAGTRSRMSTRVTIQTPRRGTMISGAGRRAPPKRAGQRVDDGRRPLVHCPRNRPGDDADRGALQRPHDPWPRGDEAHQPDDEDAAGEGEPPGQHSDRVADHELCSGFTRVWPSPVNIASKQVTTATTISIAATTRSRGVRASGSCQRAATAVRAHRLAR